MTDYEGYFDDHPSLPERGKFPSPREVEVLRHASEGRSRQETAEAMGISVQTVQTHLAEGRRKLGALNTAHAVAIAFRLGLID